MFAYFGNGWTLEDDADEGSDKTWYMGKPSKEVPKMIIERLKGTDHSVNEVLYGVEAMQPEVNGGVVT